MKYPQPIISEAAHTEPSVEDVLRVVGRGHDAYVRFFRRHDPQDPDTFRAVTSIAVHDLMNVFPAFVEQLMADSFYTINTFYRGATSEEVNLRYLNACWVDCDYGHVGDFETQGLRFGEALQIVFDRLVAKRVIPLPSVIINSGRGLWIMFLLQGITKPDLPQRAFFEKRLVWSDIQKAIYQRVLAAAPELQPDPNARDACRLTRIPGSLHTGAMRYVKYLYCGDDETGGIPGYTLADLIRFYRLDPQPWNTNVARTRTGKVPKRVGGRWGANRYRLEEFHKLRVARGGFREGHRNRAAMILAAIMRGANHTREETTKAVHHLGKDCMDRDGRFPAPLTASEVQKAVTYGYGKGYKLKNDTIADDLGVTPAEVTRLKLQKLVPGFDSTYRPKGRAKKTEHRRELILEIIAELGHVPTMHAMRTLLADRGMKASIGTVSNDYQALELKSTHEQLRERERDVRLRSLFGEKDNGDLN